jgi:peptidoglycan/xylan/chitin deacetylase (PgdA/CDA1 family)
MYHSVTEEPPASTRRLSVRPAAFAAQLRLLRDRGFTTVTFRRLGELLLAGLSLPHRPVVLTFDDGYADFHREALPALLEHGMTATVFVTTGWLADAGPAAAGRPLDLMMSWAQVGEVAAAGVEVGAHSHSHAQLDQLPLPALREELGRSKALLEDRLDAPVRSLAYPYGYFSPQVRCQTRSLGYDFAAAVGNTTAAFHEDLLALPRMTVRRSTSPETFARVVEQRDVGRIYATDRLLTRGWSAVRRGRYLVSTPARRRADREGGLASTAGA